jgi:2-oxo-4-hydroxy-4-carboxy-5-ureidoimidazoline decarboxylase
VLTSAPPVIGRDQIIARYVAAEQLVTDRVSIDTLNAADRDRFVDAVGFVYEGSPWIAAAAWEDRPWDGVEALAASMRRRVDQAPVEAREQLLRAHPDLAGRELDEGALTASSSSEQRSAGLDSLDEARRRRLRELAAEYRRRFGFPFVICVREAGAPSAILAAAERRLGGTLDEERATAIGEVHEIARLRLLDVVEGSS